MQQNLAVSEADPERVIRAGEITEAHCSSGDWVFIDLGFASSAKSCGLLIGGAEKAECFSFGDLQMRVKEICASDLSKPLNLVLEAPLSVAFNANGNPVGRAIEKREGKSRCWYFGPGCSVLIAATYLLRSIQNLPSRRAIRLFEGFVTFKSSGSGFSHKQDVIELRNLAWALTGARGRIFAPGELRANEEDNLVSAFQIAGMDFGVPPVLVFEN